MKVTSKHYQDLADAVKAKEEGKPTEYKVIPNGPWRCNGESGFQGFGTELLYRPKPEPVTRKWSKGGHVPQDCWLRSTDNPTNAYRIVLVSEDGVWTPNGTGNQLWTWERLSDSDVERSADRKTWHKCEVTEVSE